MIFLNLFLINLLSTAGEKSTNNEYCDAASKQCPDELKRAVDEKLIFYDVNPPEGFNLRRDVYMRFAIMLAEAKKKNQSPWKLVLPPWHKLYHWRTLHSKSSPQYWRSFFDVDSLKSYAPVLEFDEVIDINTQEPFEIDVLYVLQNYENPFENGVFEEKYLPTYTDCEYEGNYWGFGDLIKAKQTVCLRFQGKVSKLWEIINQCPNHNRIMFMHGEIPLHDNYGSKAYWDCRKSMKFNAKLVEAAKNFTKKNFDCSTKKCSNYFAIHWRRGDFAYSRPDDVPSVASTVNQIIAASDKYMPTEVKVFIATDASKDEFSELKSELEMEGIKVFHFDPSESQLTMFKDGGIAIIDQIVCSRALYFIGTHESTFSFRIQEEREILGFDSETTFNRFCPDFGYCERPSRWKIVR